MVFAGRNWNNGETVGKYYNHAFFWVSFTHIAELVLRRVDGSFLPTYWLLSTLCHEVGVNHATLQLTQHERTSWLISRQELSLCAKKL